MKVITLYRPWAYWVIWNWKTIETRIHNKFAILKGETIGIHAGKFWDPDAIKAADSFLTPNQKAETLIMYKEGKLPGGRILGTAHVDDHRALSWDDSRKALIICPPDLRYGLILSDIKQFNTPLPAEGHQGVWYFQIKN
ncbi:MAG TPA: hypothetical protein VHO03_03740 [Ignavibacteriales bacterium]|nr:hypothetical protein [Ignavibacteriales bacterium]